MTPADARFIRHVHLTLRTASLERCYYLAQQLAVELRARHCPAALEGAALELALLVDLETQRRTTTAAIYSADCSELADELRVRGELLDMTRDEPRPPAEQS